MEKDKLYVDGVARDLIKTLKKAVRQSRDTLLRSKKKTIVTEYDEELKKPMTEVIEESEEITTLKGTVDINALKVITGLLKEVVELSDEKFSEEGQADGGGVVVLAGVLDEDGR